MFLDFKENIELLEKVIFNFVITPHDEDLFIKPKNVAAIDTKEIIPLIKSYYFLDETLQNMYRVVKKYFKEHHRLPTKTEIKDSLNLENSSITPEQFDDALNVDLREYAYDFLYKYTKSFVLFRNLNASVTEIMSEMKTQDITPENIDKVVDKFRNDISTKLTLTLSNTSKGLDFFEPESHLQLPKFGNPTGFPFLDRVLGGGWNPKTLVVFQGRPKVGKTLVLSNLATRSVLRGVNVGVATLELSKEAYVKRMGANMLNIPVDDYANFVKGTDISVIKTKIAQLKIQNPTIGELRVEEFGTGAATALDIENYFLKIEQQTGKKFKLIVVDYLNLMRPINPKEGMYEKIKTISEELRAVAIRNEWCIVTATQVKREAVTETDLGMEDVAESFGLIHTVDTLFGLTRQPLEKHMKIKVIANRDGGETESYQKYDIDYSKSRLREMTGPADTFYSDDNESAEMEAELQQSYNNVNNDLLRQVHNVDVVVSLQNNDDDLDSLVRSAEPAPLQNIKRPSGQPTVDQYAGLNDDLDSLAPAQNTIINRSAVNYDDLLNEI